MLQLAGGIGAQQAGADLRADDERQRVGAEQQAVILGRHAIQFDKHARRTNDVGEHAGLAESARQAVRHEAAMREQITVVAQDGAPAQRHDALGRQRFLHDLGDGHHQHGAAGKHDPEQAAPRGNGQQLPACQRRQDWGQAHDQHQQRHGARCFVGFVVVADDRAGDHDARRAAHGLHHAPAGQRFNGTGQGTT
ncbi:hypothetical protein D3C72_974490 [compost metagenome]